jgi:hypothetical protein
MALTTGFQVPYGFQPTVAVPADAWSGPYEGITIAGALTAANLAVSPAIRFKSLEVRLLVNGVSQKYWYKNGITDGDLVPFDIDRYAAVSTKLEAASASWDSVYSSVNPISANWNSVYSSVTAVSANWDSVYNSVHPVSANWDSVYSSVNPISANWNSVYSSVNPISATWNSVYSTVQTISGGQYAPIRKFDIQDDGFTTYSGIALYGTYDNIAGWRITRLKTTLSGTVSSNQVAINAVWTDRQQITTYT